MAVLSVPSLPLLMSVLTGKAVPLAIATFTTEDSTGMTVGAGSCFSLSLPSTSSPDVLATGDKLHVIDVDAGPVEAEMIDGHVLGDRAIDLLPGDPMGVENPSSVVQLDVATRLVGLVRMDDARCWQHPANVAQENSHRRS